MSCLLKLNLRSVLAIQTDNTTSGIPNWAAFFVWYGWWLRRHQTPGHRLIGFSVSPTTETCAAFASLGALVGAAQIYENRLSWTDLEKLPRGTTIHFRVRNETSKTGWSQESGIVEGSEEHDGSHFIIIWVGSRRKGVAGVRRYINLAKFQDYVFTTDPPIGKNQSSVLEGNAKWFATVVSEFDKTWLWADGAELLLVTNKVGFDRAIDGIGVSAGTVDARPLATLLSLASPLQHGKTKIATPHSDLSHLAACPLTILDGLPAMRCHEHVQSGNVLIILDRAEYLDEAHNLALTVSNMRNDTALLDIGGASGDLPSGIEASVFALPLGAA